MQSKIAPFFMNQTMLPTVNDIIDELFSWAPRELAEEWDNVGLQVGYPFWPVGRAVIALDVTPETLAFALEVKADIVISHHPLIFKPLVKLDLNETTARLLAGFLRHEISVVSMHTNLDSAQGGVNDRLASLLGLINPEPLVPRGTAGAGLGRIGELSEAVFPDEFIKRVVSVLGRSCLAVAGRVQGKIKTVAVCSGSGSSLFPEAVRRGAQLYLSAEIKHSTARQAQALGMMVVDAGHFETERPVVSDIQAFLGQRSKEKGWELEVMVFEGEKSPFRFYGLDSK